MNEQNPTPAKNRTLRERPIFDKRTVIELAENQLTDVNGGSWSYIIRRLTDSWVL
jgi:hypothetical protein